MFRRIELREAAAEDADGRSAAVEGAAVRGRVDPAREPRHHGHADGREFRGEAPRLSRAVRRRAPRADDGDSAQREERRVAADEEHERRVVELRERPRPAGASLDEDLRPGRAHALEVPRGVVAARRAGEERGPRVADARHRCDARRLGAQRRRRRAEPREQTAHEPRRESRDARETEPVEQLGLSRLCGCLGRGGHP